MDEHTNPLLSPSARRRLGITLAVVLTALLVISLIPMLALSRYSRPAYDDYSYGRAAHQALESGENVLAAVAYSVWDTYLSWQGSVTAVALMSLTPLVFSEHLYWITTVVMLASLILGTMKLSHTLVCRLLKGAWWESLLVCVPMLLLSIQFVVAPLEAFYWWNGAVYYTFTYGISLLYIERMVSLFCPGRRPVWWLLVSGVLCAVMVGGSNYVSALLCTMLAGCLLLLALWRGKKREWVGMLILFAGEVVPFLLSVVSPGNQVRQATVSSMSPIVAILASIAKAGQDLLRWSNPLTLVLCLAWAPLLYRLAGQCKLRFRLPGVVWVFTFLFFAAQNAPHFYAVSISGPGRLRNIVYYSHLWVILLDEWYFLGWLRQSDLIRRLDGWRRNRKPLAVGGGAVMLALCLIFGWFYAPSALSVNCVRAISDGSAAAFAREWDERLAQYQDPAVTDLVFSPLHNMPPLLVSGDLAADPSDPDYWVNLAQAQYYGKSSATLRP